MPNAPPPDPADHAADFSRRYELPLDQYCAIRMQELGIPGHLHGAPDFGGDGRWRAFIARGRSGGNITSGITLNSGFAGARLRDRIDAIIAHEYEEDRLGSHEAALKHAPRTELLISDGARRILRAMGR